MTSALDALPRDFSGSILRPGDDGYDVSARTVFASGHPLVVLRPRTVDDVRLAVGFAEAASRPVAVRGGGHSFAGFGTNDDGVVIDLGALSEVTIIDRPRRLVRIGGGTTWGAVATALAPHGLAISSGDTKSVGVGGLTLGGGIGWKVRRYGLALDSLVAAEVVSASGKVMRASASVNPELFWALRGGGGGFGIVTAFEFLAHPTTDVFFGTISFAPAEAATVLAGWADYLRTAPEELTSTVDFANPFAGGANAPIAVHVAFDGDDPQLAHGAIDPIRRLGTVLEDGVALTPYSEILVEGLTPPPGFGFATRSAFVNGEAVPKVLPILAETGASGQSPFISIRALGGAVARVPADTTAFAHRDAELMFVTTVAGPQAVVEAGRPALDALWARLSPETCGAYGNFLSSVTAADVAAVYPGATGRHLAEAKRRYDPADLFAGNLASLPDGRDVS